LTLLLSVLFLGLLADGDLLISASPPRLRGRVLLRLGVSQLVFLSNSAALPGPVAPPAQPKIRLCLYPSPYVAPLLILQGLFEFRQAVRASEVVPELPSPFNCFEEETDLFERLLIFSMVVLLCWAG